MSEETKEETKKVFATIDDYEKAKTKFDRVDYSEEEFFELANLYASSFNDVQEGEPVKGTIVSILDDSVIVDVGFKSEGSIDIFEFGEDPQLKIGDEIEVVLESVEDHDGNLVLSKQRADFLNNWKRVMNAHDTGEILEGKIIKRIKGGMVVDLFGMEAFLPGSQIDVRPIRDFDAFVGQTMDFKVVKVNVPTENVVVSHKVLVEEEISGQRNAILEGLEKGQILEGIVKAITDFGVFVDLGGIDGLVHITDLSWGRINHPNEIVKLDETIKVVVTDFDEEKKRISLSLKKLMAHPWEKIDTRYSLKDKVSGRVVSLTDYGAFIEIEKGIEGLIGFQVTNQMISIPSMIILSFVILYKGANVGMKALYVDFEKDLPLDFLTEILSNALMLYSKNTP